MRRWGHLVLLPWALWAHLDTQSVPAGLEAVRTSDAIEHFATYEQCDRRARWAETQPDMREEWTVDEKGGRWYTTIAPLVMRALSES
jgi:hypothetical protein